MGGANSRKFKEIENEFQQALEKHEQNVNQLQRQLNNEQYERKISEKKLLQQEEHMIELEHQVENVNKKVDETGDRQTLLFNAMANLADKMKDLQALSSSERSDRHIKYHDSDNQNKYCFIIKDLHQSEEIKDSISKMKTVLKRFHFEVEEVAVEAITDVPRHLNKVAKVNGTYSCLLVMIAAKGLIMKSGGIGFRNDQQRQCIGMESIWKRFTNDDCNWKGKPKLFFFQMDGLECTPSQILWFQRTYPSLASSHEDILLMHTVGKINMIRVLANKLQQGNKTDIKRLAEEIRQQDENIRVACTLQKELYFAN